MAGEKMEVMISLRTIGPARPTTLRVHSLIQVRDLRRSVAAQGGHPLAQLKLVFRGRTLEDGDDRLLRLHDGDTLVAAVVPKAPAKHLHEGHDDDDDDDLKYHISESETWWKRKLFYFLQKRLRLPDILLMAIFSISLKTWSIIILWFSLLPVAHKFSLGPLYILATGFSVIFLNLGRRQPGDASAYSIFNEDFRELPGTLNADRIDRDIRAGQI